MWLYAVVILGPRLRVTLPSLKLGFQENTGQGSQGGAFPSQSARKGEQAWRSMSRRIVWAKARGGAHHLCSCSAGENRVICHLPPLNYKESWDTGSARMFTERGKAFGGQPATTEPFLRSRCLDWLLVKWEGAWGPRHSDSAAEARTCLQRVDRVSFPQIAREVSSGPVRLILSVDTKAALWREISYPWEASQLFLQNGISVGKNEFQGACGVFVHSV